MSKFIYVYLYLYIYNSAYINDSHTYLCYRLITLIYLQIHQQLYSIMLYTSLLKPTQDDHNNVLLLCYAHTYSYIVVDDDDDCDNNDFNGNNIQLVQAVLVGMYSCILLGRYRAQEQMWPIKVYSNHSPCLPSRSEQLLSSVSGITVRINILSCRHVIQTALSCT
jgi:hypothetical protein